MRAATASGSPRPFDYVWNGQRVSHYLNHAGEWHSCPATKDNHHTIIAPTIGRSDR
jgi:hypothetical protein